MILLPNLAAYRVINLLALFLFFCVTEAFRNTFLMYVCSFIVNFQKASDMSCFGEKGVDKPVLHYTVELLDGSSVQFYLNVSWPF